jgi:hypothetical protein
MSLRFTDDGDGMDPGGVGGADVVGGEAGGAIVGGGGGVAKAGVRVDGNRVWMLRCCAAASGARTRTARRRRCGRGAIAVTPW